MKARHRLVAFAAQMVAAAVLVALSSSAAWAMRVAVLVGNDVGASREEHLRYAEVDAVRMGELFVRIAGFSQSDTLVLRGRTVAEVRQAFEAASAKLAGTPGEHLFVFYYSGHADAQSLHLGSESLSFFELKTLSLALPAAARVLVVDACQSGALTRLKGGRPAVAFQLPDEEPPRGLAILASARDSEFAQESDDLQGSFFTHHLHAGLAGRADANRDGRVSLSEAFHYASQETLSATARTWAGPQHPIFRYDLVGQVEVVLSYPGQLVASSGFGRLRLDRPGWFFVRRWPESAHGNLVAEIRNTASESVALEAGRYLVEEREDDELRVARAEVVSGTVTALASLPVERIRFGRAVRKGGLLRGRAFAVSLDGVTRSALAELGPGLGLAPGVRFDRPRGSFEVRLGLLRSFRETYVPTTTWDVSLSASLLRLWDFTPVTLGAGVELGGGLIRRQEGSSSAELIPFAALGPRILAEVPLADRFTLRADVAVAGTMVPFDQGRGPAWSPFLSVRAGMGIGGYL